MTLLQNRRPGMVPEKSADEETTRAVFTTQTGRRLNFNRSKAASFRTCDGDFIAHQMS